MKRTVISATDWRFDKPERKPLSESSDLTDHLTEMTEVTKVVKRSITVDDISLPPFQQLHYAINWMRAKLL